MLVEEDGMTMRKKIENLIFNKDEYSAYSIAKGTGVSQSIITNLRNKKREISRISFGNAEKIANYWDVINGSSSENRHVLPYEINRGTPAYSIYTYSVTDYIRDNFNSSIEQTRKEFLEETHKKPWIAASKSSSVVVKSSLKES